MDSWLAAHLFDDQQFELDIYLNFLTILQMIDVIISRIYDVTAHLHADDIIYRAATS